MYEVKIIRDGETYSYQFINLENALAYIQHVGKADDLLRGINTTIDVEFKLARVSEAKEPVT